MEVVSIIKESLFSKLMIDTFRVNKRNGLIVVEAEYYSAKVLDCVLKAEQFRNMASRVLCF